MSDGLRSFAHLASGDLLPRFRQSCQGIQFAPDAMAGHYLLFCLLGSAGTEQGHRAVEAVLARRDRFDDRRFSAFLISFDAEDQAQSRIRDTTPGIRAMWDIDRSVGRLLGAVPREGDTPIRPLWILTDPSLHILDVVPMTADGSEADALFERLDLLPHPSRFAGFEIPAPVLVLPNVLDRDLRRHLIGLYDQHGGGESGVMRNNVGVFDRSFKSRKDYTIDDERLVRHLQGLIARRVVPEIERLFFMKITRMERYMVGCYAAEDGGHFRPHRDNGPGVTEHRRFAVSVNLNDDFEGGAVSFPEYNPRGIKAPAGWAVVFPANILHAVGKVTSGRRYAFLPFVYDEGGAAIRQANLQKAAAAAAAEAAKVA